MDDKAPNYDNEMLDWQCTESFLEECFDVSNSLWGSMNQNDIPLSFEDGFTPVKSCGDLADHVNICGDSSKESEKFGEHSSQANKRRRLHFNSEFSEPSLGNVEISPAQPIFEEMEDSAIVGSSDMSQKVSGYSECTSSPGYEIVDQPSDAWVGSCLNDNEMHYTTTNMASDVQIDKTEFCKTQSTLKFVKMNQDRTVGARANAFRGRKSYIQTPTKLASSVVYPFTFIKPCGILGDVTLKDINQLIRTPPPKLKENSDDPSSYPTSAFSGKPVVGRTTLSTDGGRGSITIMRTKG